MPIAEPNGRPCGDQLGTWNGVGRHRRAEARHKRGEDSRPWEDIALERCPLCTDANREHAREQYAKRPRWNGPVAQRRRAVKS